MAEGQKDYYSEKEFFIFELLIERIQKNQDELYHAILSDRLSKMNELGSFGRQKLYYLKNGWSIEFTSNFPELKWAQSMNNLNILHLLDAHQERINNLESEFKEQASFLPPGVLEEGRKKDGEKISRFIEIIAKESRTTPLKFLSGDNKKIAMFTPLAPIKSGIADYIEDILLAFDECLQIDLYIDDNYKPSNQRLANKCRVFNHKEFHQKHYEYGFIVYQMGNNSYHSYMIPYILKYPGVIELHDYKLSHLVAQLPPQYLQMAKKVEDIERYGDNWNDIPYNNLILQNSLAIIVHNNYTALNLIKQSPKFNVHKIPLFVKDEALLDAEDHLRKKYGLSGSLVISSFGFVTPTKRILQTLKAFSRIIQEIRGESIKYLVVGEVDEECDKEIRDFIKKQNLMDNVIITGYTTLDSFVEYMQVSDICVNLRYPYGGESSGTVSRILGLRKACIVSDIGAFAEIPDECCLKVPYGTQHEEEHIYLALRKLVYDRKYRRELGERAGEYVERHLTLRKITEEFEKYYTHGLFESKYDLGEIINKVSDFITYNSLYDQVGSVEYAIRCLQGYLHSDYFEKEEDDTRD